MRTNWLERWFAALLLAAFVLGAIAVLRQAIWAPRDEWAHFDYIDHLSAGHWPHPDEAITADTFDMCVREFQWPKPPEFDGTRATMSVFGVSYEAWQPPLYYALLAVPNLVLEWCDASATTRIVSLRMLTLLSVYAGLLMIVALFAELAKLGAVDRTVGWFVAFVLAVTNLQHYWGLGNDNLAPLIGATFLWLHARHYRLGRPSDLWWAAVVAGLGIWCKLTNGLLPMIHVAVCVFLRPRSGPVPSLRARLATLVVPVAMGSALLLYNCLRFGDVLNTSVTEARFASRILTTDDTPLFLTFLVHDSLLFIWHNGAQFVASFPHTLGWWWWFAAALATNALLLVGSAIRGRWGARQGVVLFAVSVTSVVLAVAVVLNLRKPVANWYNFRHFFAYAVPWFVAVGLPAVRLPPLFGRAAIMLCGVAGTAVLVWFAVILSR